MRGFECGLCCGVAGQIGGPAASSSIKRAHECPPLRAAVKIRRGEMREVLSTVAGT